MFLFLQNIFQGRLLGFHQWLTVGDGQSFQARWQVLVQRFQLQDELIKYSSSRDSNWSRDSMVAFG